MAPPCAGLTCRSLGTTLQGFIHSGACPHTPGRRAPTWLSALRWALGAWPEPCGGRTKHQRTEMTTRLLPALQGRG